MHDEPAVVAGDAGSCDIVCDCVDMIDSDGMRDIVLLMDTIPVSVSVIDDERERDGDSPRPAQ